MEKILHFSIFVWVAKIGQKVKANISLNKKWSEKLANE